MGLFGKSSVVSEPKKSIAQEIVEDAIAGMAEQVVVTGSGLRDEWNEIIRLMNKSGYIATSFTLASMDSGILFTKKESS